MSGSYAWEHGLPCKNSSCSSYGSPHPNCRCYGDHAAGGEVKPFCSETRSHNADCQYFQAGGEASLDPDAYLAYTSDVGAPPAPAGAPPAPAGAPPAPAGAPPAPAGAPPPPPAPAGGPPPPSPAPKEEPPVPFDPDSYLGQKAGDEERAARAADRKQQTAGPLKTLQAMVEGAGRSLMPGYSWFEANQQNLDFMSPEKIQETLKDVSPEAQVAREEEHPIASAVGSMGAMAGSLFTGFGAPGMIAKGTEAALAARAAPGIITEAAAARAAAPVVMREIGRKTVAGFVTNGLIQGNDEISKALLGQGDPEAPVSSALLNMGYMGLIGGGAGALTGVGPRLVPANKIADMKVGNRFYSWLLGMKQALEEPNASNRFDYTKTPIRPASKLVNEFGEPIEPALPAKKIIDESGEPFPSTEETPQVHPGAYRAGQKFIDKLAPVSTLSLMGTGAVADAAAQASIGYKKDGLLGAAKGAGQGAYQGAIGGALASAAKYGGMKALGGKYGLPMIIKAAQNGTFQHLTPMLNYAGNIERGATKAANCIEDLFRAGSQFGYDKVEHEKQMKSIDDYIQQGGVTQDIQNSLYDANAVQGYAEGGSVQPLGSDDGRTINGNNDAIADNFPDQNVMLQAARGRISNYLSALRPPGKGMPKLAFDDEPDTSEQQKSYRRALSIAAEPLTVLQEAKKGTLEAEHVKHFNTMYPEVANHLQKKVTQRISEAQIKGEKPSYKVRQALSMLLGKPLSGEMTPANIQAAQATFSASQGGTPPPPAKPKKGTSILTKSDQAYLTSSQALTKRQLKV